MIVPLTVQELPDERLPAGHVAVHFDPGCSSRLERAFRHALFDSSEKRRVELLRPLELLSLGRGEAVLGISVHQVDLSRPGSGGLLLGD